MERRLSKSGVLVATVVAGAAWLVLGRRRWEGGVRGGRIREGGRSPEFLRASILGTGKGMVQSVFGVPRAASGMAAVPGEGRGAYWEADTWYYALDRSRRTAMVVRFEEGVAREVEFVEG